MEERINPAIEANRNQFLSTYHMLKKLVAICPEEVWEEQYHGTPFWYHVYHCVYYIDYWFRKEYDSEFIPLVFFAKELSPDRFQDVPEESFIERSKMQDYLEILDEKIKKFFNGLSDSDLGKEIMKGATNYTYMDIIIGQNRHIMYNVGYLNGILRSLQLPESDWWAYNEKEERIDKICKNG